MSGFFIKGFAAIYNRFAQMPRHLTLLHYCRPDTPGPAAAARSMLPPALLALLVGVLRRPSARPLRLRGLSRRRRAAGTGVWPHRLVVAMVGAPLAML